MSDEGGKEVDKQRLGTRLYTPKHDGGQLLAFSQRRVRSFGESKAPERSRNKKVRQSVMLSLSGPKGLSIGLELRIRSSEEEAAGHYARAERVYAYVYWLGRMIWLVADGRRCTLALCGRRKAIEPPRVGGVLICLNGSHNN